MGHDDPARQTTLSDEEVLRGFEDHTLSADRFHHREHVLVAFRAISGRAGCSTRWRDFRRRCAGSPRRVTQLLGVLSHRQTATEVARQLSRARSFTDTNIMLTLVTTWRESLKLVPTGAVETWHSGGLDHLWTNRSRLGLPKQVTEAWRPGPTGFDNTETKRDVAPGIIPGKDQAMAYAAQTASSFNLSIKRRLEHSLGADAGSTLARSSRVSKLIWQALAFLAPGGNEYHPKQPARDQLHNRHFGSQSVLSYVIGSVRSKDPKADVSLDQVFKDPAVNDNVWVKSAKTRVVETLLLERLLTTVRELRIKD
jgi:hypothetical protein